MKTFKQLQELLEAKATPCGKCGTTHVPESKGGDCPATNESVELDEAKDIDYHKAELKTASDKIDSIVKSGGRVGLNDPLSAKVKHHSDQIKKLKLTKIKEALDEVVDTSKDQKHRVSVTVSEPDHPSVTQRKEKIQRFVRVTASDKDTAVQKAQKHYKKLGYKVHSAEHHSIVKEEAEQIDELSKDTLTSYRDQTKEKRKAYNDAIRHVGMSGGDDKRVADWSKEHDRLGGKIKIANRKIKNKDKAGVSEEADQVDEAAKNKLMIGSKVTHPDHGKGKVVMHGQGGGSGTIVKFNNGKKVNVDYKQLKIVEEAEQVEEKTLTAAELKKREEIAQAIKRENPKMPMDKKMAIATAAAKRVAEAAKESIDEISDKTLKSYTSKAMQDTLAGKKNRGDGMSKAYSRLSGTNKPLISTDINKQ